MTCMECGSQMKTKRENYKYDASGLRGITLIDVEVSRCGECGEEEVTIQNIEGLHRAIALTIVQKREKLAGDEIRFLRKYLGLSGGDFAEHIGVSMETVSRWEHDRTPMGVTADRFLRWLVVTREPVSHYPLEMLKGLARDKPKRLKVGMKSDEGGWHATRERELVTA
jgi:putative transcriptional regulator